MNTDQSPLTKISFEDWWTDLRIMSVKLFGPTSLRSLTADCRPAWHAYWEEGKTPAQAIMEDLEE